MAMYSIRSRAGVLRTAQLRPAVQVVPGHAHRSARRSTRRRSPRTASGCWSTRSRIEFFAAVVRQAKLRRYVSSDHFSVDGTLLEAWASHKSFKPKDGPPPAAAGGPQRRGPVARRRSAPTTPTPRRPTPRPGCIARATTPPATLCYSGHLLMENRNALIVDAELTTADGYAERATAVEMLARLPTTRPAAHRRRRQGLRHQRVRRRRPRARVHPARRPEHHPATLRDRRAHHPTRRARRSACGSANGSRNPSAGSRPSAAAASSATSADNATGPGSRSPPPSTT